MIQTNGELPILRSGALGNLRFPAKPQCLETIRLDSFGDKERVCECVVPVGVFRFTPPRMAVQIP